MPVLNADLLNAVNYINWAPEKSMNTTLNTQIMPLSSILYRHSIHVTYYHFGYNQLLPFWLQSSCQGNGKFAQNEELTTLGATIQT